jgi:hypothetical protein
MKNPIPAAARFLQNFPGECNRTAFYIAKAISRRPVVCLLAAVMLGQFDYVTWSVGGLAIKMLPQLPNFIHENTASVSIKVTSLIVISCFLPGISTGMTIHALKTMRETGEQLHHPKQKGPWGFRPNPPPSRQP